jgi:ASC-1-like (ASCH) protein
MKEGVKKIEVRVDYPFLRGIKTEQIIKFQCGREYLEVKIKDVRRYKTFVFMLNNEDYRLIAKDKTKQEILNICQTIYPPQKESLGVLIFEVELIK